MKFQTFLVWIYDCYVFWQKKSRKGITQSDYLLKQDNPNKCLVFTGGLLTDMSLSSKHPNYRAQSISQDLFDVVAMLSNLVIKKPLQRPS